MAYESLYEESAINLKENKHKTYYLVALAFQILFIAGAVLWAIVMLLLLPLPNPEKNVPFIAVLPDWIFFFGVLFTLICGAIVLRMVKRRFNVSFDYLCVSGELRISKVFNVKKRKFICRLDASQIIQLGDIENPSYERFRKMPGVKEVVCTPNMTAGRDKFFMYIFAHHEGTKKIFLLECREGLLINLMQYLRRDVLDRDYVPQAKKM